MSEDRVVELRHPGSFSKDPLTSVLRSGARRLLAQAVEMEVTAFIAAHGDLEDDAGRRRVVRHGHHRERQVQTGIGPVAVRCPRVRDRGGSGEAGKIRFTSAILPPYLRRAKSIEELLPWLYLKGISTGDFTEALAALLGPDAPGLSASTITRLKDVWQGESESSRTSPGTVRKPCLERRRTINIWCDRKQREKPLKQNSVVDFSLEATAPSTTRPRPAWPRTARGCSPSTTFRLSTGSTCARPIP